MAKNPEDQMYENLCKLSSTSKEIIALVRLLIAQFDNERVNRVIGDARMQEFVDEHFFDIKDAADNFKLLSMYMDNITTLRKRPTKRRENLRGSNADSGYARSIDSGVLGNEVQAVEEQNVKRHGCVQTDIIRSLSVPIQEENDEIDNHVTANENSEKLETSFSDTCC